MTTSNCYLVLGINPPSDLAEIKKAFRRQALKLHPDQGGNEQAFLELKEAFEYAIKQTQSDRTTHVYQEYGFSGYDPFTDPSYESYSFFEPENDNLARFERSILAEGCKHCDGLAIRSKLIHPERGFAGREERFCICQRIK